MTVQEQLEGLQALAHGNHTELLRQAREYEALANKRRAEAAVQQQRAADFQKAVHALSKDR